jgi:uncharacterized protein YqgC (DUF456 family)
MMNWLYVWITLLVLVNLTCLVLTLFGLPGNWLMLIMTVLFAWWQGENQLFSVTTLVVAALLALTGEIIEFFAGMVGARKAGSRRRGSIGALIGTIVGAILGSIFLMPIIGTIIGACLGACGGAFLLEKTGGRESRESFRSGIGAGVGVLVGTTSKLLLGVLIWLILTLAAYIP